MFSQHDRWCRIEADDIISDKMILTPRRITINTVCVFAKPFSTSASCSIDKRTRIRKTISNTEKALEYFDGFYSKVYQENWPSMRLGLLTSKKQCAVLNSFTDTDDVQSMLQEDFGAINLQMYYKKHLRSYIRWQLRQKIIENKKIRKREMMAQESNVDVQSIDLNDIEVSDVSDSELRAAQTTDGSEGFSTAEDLQEMFSDRRYDDDERYFINKASPDLSLEDYMPATEYIARDDIEDLSYYEADTSGMEPDVEFREEPPFIIDEQLKIYTFPRQDWSKFESPPKEPTVGLLSYYVLDGASILSVLSLDVQVNDACADYCSAPGGKALGILMTLKPSVLHCNDISTSRISRLSKVIREYVPDINYVKDTLKITRSDARAMVLPDTFDKILVDVPCSNDRISATALENNIFKSTRYEERQRLPYDQCAILKSALKSLKLNGVVLYTTCTMSPIENDGVVRNALNQLEQDGLQYKFAIMNMKECFRPLRGLFSFNTGFKYGQQVVPSIHSNFGPMYISKIKRIA